MIQQKATKCGKRMSSLPLTDLSLTSSRARSTSAAPTYFEPFVHPKTKKIYQDGAVIRNNPVKLAYEESHLIWRRSSTDIIVSLGTGVQIQENGRPSPSDTFSIPNIIFGGLRKKLILSSDMVQQTLDCEREWNEFLVSHHGDREFLQICHRLNVGINAKLPKIDGVAKMEGLQTTAHEYLSSSHRSYWNHHNVSVRSHLRTVANQLRASLFYFGASLPNQNNPQPSNGTRPRGQQDLTDWTGSIRCRLNPSLQSQFTSLLEHGVEFRVNDEGVQPQPIHVTFDIRSFTSPICFPVRANSDSWYIEMRFGKTNDLTPWFRISGFH